MIAAANNTAMQNKAMVVNEMSLITIMPATTKIKANIKSQKSHFGGLYIFSDIVIFCP